MLSGAVRRYRWRFVLLYFLTPTYGSIRPLLPIAQSCHQWAEIVVLRNVFFSPTHFQVWEQLPISSANPATIRSAVLAFGAKEFDWPVLAPSVVLAAHDGKWLSLRHYQFSKIGSDYFHAEQYRTGIANLVSAWKV
jgi:hypothetical protein